MEELHRLSRAEFFKKIREYEASNRFGIGSGK